MATDITVPVFPESVTEGTILTWHKQPGEKVTRDELLAEIETDKIVFGGTADGEGGGGGQGASHSLGQNFAKAFGITFNDVHNEQAFAHTTSWGLGAT